MWFSITFKENEEYNMYEENYGKKEIKIIKKRDEESAKQFACKIQIYHCNLFLDIDT